MLSYIARAPTFPVETRFHASQAFMLSILQFPASVLFPIMEKAGVPGKFVGFKPYLVLTLLNHFFEYVNRYGYLIQHRVSLGDDKFSIYAAASH